VRPRNVRPGTGLRELDDRIKSDGPFVAYSSRVLVEARKPQSSGVGAERLIAAFVGFRTDPDETISRMNMAMMGLMGAVAGASTVGIVEIMRSMAQTWVPRIAANSEHKHQMLANLQSQRDDAVKRWRAGLADARDSYRQWAAGPRDNGAPNVVGDEWFEGLRPHLPTAGEAAKYRIAHEVSCDNPTVALLSLEIGRIEREWVDETQGYPRRARKQPN
jgi:hypothetical protein